jgi:hypothetical protein
MPSSTHLCHATPLHYLPHILSSGALYAKSVTAGQGIKPRFTALRRDIMLGLTDWVHLSTRPDTPLLKDKLARGYPHALLVFDRAAVLALPEVALLPYNTKAWHSKADYVPVTDAAEKTEMLRRHDETHRYPSLEVLVHYGLDFAHLQKIVFSDEEERQWIVALMTALGCELSAPLEVDTGLFPLYNCGGETRLATCEYLAACCEANLLLPPPLIPFD